MTWNGTGICYGLSTRSIRIWKRPKFSAAFLPAAVRRMLFANVKDCQFPMVSNLFGSMERTRFIFRDTLASVKRLIDLKIDPGNLRKAPIRYGWAALSALRMLPKRVRSGPVMKNATRIDQLPQLKVGRRTAGRSLPCRRSTGRTSNDRA